MLQIFLILGSKLSRVQSMFSKKSPRILIIGQGVVEPLKIKEGISTVPEGSTPEALTFFFVYFGAGGALVKVKGIESFNDGLVISQE